MDTVQVRGYLCSKMRCYGNPEKQQFRSFEGAVAKLLNEKENLSICLSAITRQFKNRFS